MWPRPAYATSTHARGSPNLRRAHHPTRRETSRGGRAAPDTLLPGRLPTHRSAREGRAQRGSPGCRRGKKRALGHRRADRLRSGACDRPRRHRLGKGLEEILRRLRGLGRPLRIADADGGEASEATDQIAGDRSIFRPTEGGTEQGAERGGPKKGGAGCVSGDVEGRRSRRRRCDRACAEEVESVRPPRGRRGGRWRARRSRAEQVQS